MVVEIVRQHMAGQHEVHCCADKHIRVEGRMCSRYTYDAYHVHSWVCWTSHLSSRAFIMLVWTRMFGHVYVASAIKFETVQLGQVLQRNNLSNRIRNSAYGYLYGS